MHDNHQLHETMTKCPEPGKFVGFTGKNGPVSPLGWSILGRLMWAALAAVLLWLSVAWAIGWLT
jgi:hypothetical protein